MYKNVPNEIAELSQWCYVICGKQPLIRVNNLSLAKPLHSLDQSKRVGFITTQQNDYAIIDIDVPADEKDKILEKIQNGKRLEDILFPVLPKILTFLIERTYAEYSLSGAGIHLVVKVDKSEMNPTKRAYRKGKTFTGQISFTNNFMVFTGNKLPCSSSTVYTVNPIELEQLSQILANEPKGADNMRRLQRAKQRVQEPTEPKAKDYAEGEEQLMDKDLVSSATPEIQQLEFEALPPVRLVEQALQLCTLDQNPRVKEVYKEILSSAYEHYNYWLVISMALHDYSIRSGDNARMYSLFLDWSMTDPVAFTSEEDCEEKWKSFSYQSTQAITYKTLFKFASLLEFDYPRPKLDRRGRSTGVPINSEFVNFEYLVNKFHLKIFEEDLGNYYLQGDKDILDKYFEVQGAKWLLGYLGPVSRNQLYGSALRLCQDCKYKNLLSVSTLVDTWLTLPREPVDFFKIWLDTPFEDLPIDFKFDNKGNYLGLYDENSTFEYLNSCIVWNASAQDEILSKKMLYKTIMQLIKFHEPVAPIFDGNGGMFALIGPENTYKTTFFKMWMPPQLDFLRKELNMPTNSDKGLRDFVRYLGKKAIVQIDEFEGFLDQKRMGPILKSIISGSNMSLTDIYQTADTKLDRKAIIVATSNEKKHIISANGSRRMWLCEVLGIDTKKLLKFNWHTFYNSMRVEFRLAMQEGNLPWLMEMEETKETSARNEIFSTKTDLEIALEMIFGPAEDFTTLDNCNLLSTGEVLRQLWNIDLRNVPLARLERALERFCSMYTSDVEKYHEYKGEQVLIEQGKLVCKNESRLKLGLSRAKKIWVLPRLEEN